MSEKPTYEELEQRVRELEQGESERKQIELELHRRAEELAVLNALARRVSATLSLEKTCDAAVKGVHEAVNPTVAFIFLREGEALILKGIAPQWVDKRLDRPFEHRVGECICGLAVRDGQAMFSRDIHTDKRCTWKECKEAGFRSLAAIPLRNGDDVIGVMGLAEDVERDFETQSGFLEMIASQVSMAFNNNHLYEQVRRELAEHKQTEEALRQSEAKFRELADMLPQIVFETDVKGNLTFVNHNAFNAFGYTKDHFASGLNAIQMIAPKDRDRAADRMRKRMRGQSNFIGSEYTAKKKDGTEFPVIIYSNRFLRDGSTAGLRGIMIDITERKQVEAELLGEKRFSESLISQLPGSFYMFAEKGRMLRWNSNLEKITGYSGAEIQQMNPLDFFAEDEKAKVHQRIQEVFDRGASEVEANLLTKEGYKIPHVFTGSKIEYAGVNYLVGVGLDITERKQAEVALNESEERFRQITDNIKEVFWLFDWQQQQVLYVSPAFELIWGRSLEALYERYDEWGESIHPDDLQHAQKTFNRILETGGGEPREYRIVRPDGSVRWISDTGYAIKDGNGEIIRITGVAEDITAKKQAEQELIEKRHLLEETQALAHVGSWGWDIRTNANTWSDEMFRIFGYEPNAVIPNYDVFVKALHPADKDRILAAVNQTIKEDVPYAEEYCIIRPDQSKRTVFATGQVHRNGKGRASRMVGAVLDITERKHIEEALNSEKERLSVTLRSIGDAVIATDRSGRITLINPIAENLTGWPETEAKGRPLSEVFNIVNEMTGQPCLNPVQQVLETGKIQGLSNHTMLISRDGNQYNVADSAAPIMDSGQTIVGAILVFRDITAAQRTEAELQKIEKLRSLGVLAGGIAHDFNNFLTGIIGNLSLAKLDLDPSNRIYPRLNEMEKAALRAKDLTQQLLTFSKGGEPVKRLTQIDTLVREAALFALRGSNVRCQFDFPDDFWPAQVDAGQIGQVVHNLVINADQVMPEGGIIAISGKNADVESGSHLKLSPGHHIKIIVQDQGTGIKKEHLDKIYDPYFTTKQKGSGLGLTVVYSIIEKHDGQVTVYSELGVGTTFNIYLPASPDSVMKTATAEETIITGSGRILVMDDEKYIRTLASEMLSKMGYEAALAKDGAEVIKKYRQATEANQPFDAVILDLTIPGGMGGQETMARLTQIDKHVKAIVSSGYSNDPVMSNYREYGFISAVRKPYVIKELSDAMRKLK